jgi:hypothetical protein
VCFFQKKGLLNRTASHSAGPLVRFFSKERSFEQNSFALRKAFGVFFSKERSFEQNSFALRRAFGALLQKIY